MIVGSFNGAPPGHLEAAASTNWAAEEYKMYLHLQYGAFPMNREQLSSFIDDIWSVCISRKTTHLSRRLIALH